MHVSIGGIGQEKCGRKVCNSRRLTHYNPSTEMLYCPDCSRKINQHNPDLCKPIISDPILWVYENGLPSLVCCREKETLMRVIAIWLCPKHHSYAFFPLLYNQIPKTFDLSLEKGKVWIDPRYKLTNTHNCSLLSSPMGRFPLEKVNYLHSPECTKCFSG